MFFIFIALIMVLYYVLDDHRTNIEKESLRCREKTLWIGGGKVGLMECLGVIYLPKI
jgi:uncharacterized membrane protein YsdA (DUF1294 family)